MSRRPKSPRTLGRLLIVLAALSGPSCCPGPQPPRRDLAPEPHFARRALEEALDEWRSSPRAKTTANGRSMIFIDQQRRPGQELRDYTILGETVLDNRRRYVVRLSLAKPDETVLAAYYVFDRTPVWVYRVEDFDMMMHMDMAPDDVSAPAGVPDKAATPDRSPGHGGDHGPGMDAGKTSG